MEKDFSDLQTEGSAESLRRSLESQRELFHEQIDQFQKIVLAQCNLTGVNPLAQEMAAGALSIKIGKRPRDLLNPKAVKYMQYIFSIKDVVNKKECREISALFGVTATQAREYFASQRSRVRKIVSSSREKAISSNTCLELPEEIPTSTDSLVVPMDIVPLNTIVPNKSEEPPFCSTEDDVLSGIDDSDKQFVENIFSLMHKEETFSGQVKLMEWVLRIQNSAVLSWFLSKGGTVILATWLTQAAVEEQTSVLLVILNVLCHLPLNKALPIHMSAILQSVNRLRFYKSSDISNRARVLLAKWSKLLARSQALKKFNGGTQYIDAQREILLKQSLKDVVADESWQSNFDSAENILSCSDDFWKSEPTQVLRILPPPSDDSNKKNILGVSSSQIRERRKVQLVEQPGQKTSGRSPQAGRAGPSNQSRPMSTDDIQKAKMRAQLMQNKYKKASLSNENKKLKTEIQNRPSTLTGTVPPAPRVPVQPIDDKHKKHVPLPVIATNRLENSLDLNPKMDLKESIWERCRRVQIPWQTPPEVKLSDPWSVGAGENSKEVEVQKNRNRREKETMYLVAKEIPQNPKEPWDREMDYDDTLTPVIPAEQLPEGDIIETQIDSPTESENGVVTASQFHAGNATATEPDLELLAVLLKNPELVIALTSGQTANMSSAEKMKLLDMIKAGRNATTSLNGVVSKQVEHKVEVSLPSPTPPSNPGTSGWRPEVARNPFSQQLHRVAGNQSATTVAAKQVSSIHLSTPQVVSEAVPQYSAAQVTSVVHQKYAQFGGQLHHNDNSLTSSSSVQRTNLYTPNITNSSHIVSSPMNNSEERFRMALSPSPPLVRLPPQQRQHYQAGPAYTKEYVNSSSESWRARDYNNSSLISQSNNGYVLYDGPAQTGPPARRIPVGPRWEGNEYREREDYETWSPENSPSRNREGSAMMGRNFSEQRTSGYRGDHSRARNSSNSSGYSDYNNRYGSRKWHDDRRR